MSKYKGFSLVELVVVILLIGILSAVAVPRLFSSLDKAAAAVAVGFKAELISAMKLIRAEWMLAGQRTSLVLDGRTLTMSALGFPVNIAAAAGEPELCGFISSTVLGVSPESIAPWSSLTPATDAASQTARDTILAGKDWVYFTEAQFDTLIAAVPSTFGTAAAGATAATPGTLNLTVDGSATAETCYWVYVRNELVQIVQYSGLTRELVKVRDNEFMQGRGTTEYERFQTYIRTGA